MAAAIQFAKPTTYARTMKVYNSIVPDVSFAILDYITHYIEALQRANTCVCL
jgi:hypothetical protein